jgi:hypothetical protein
MVVHVALEMVRTMKPGASADEDTARKPFWAVVPVGGTAIRRRIVVTVGAVRGGSDVNADLGPNLGSGRRKNEPGNHREREMFRSVHVVSSVLGSLGIFRAEDVCEFALTLALTLALTVARA